MIEVSCPICNSSLYKKLYQKNKLWLVECRQCRLIYVNPRPKEEEIDSHYSKDYYYCPDKAPDDNTRYLDYNKPYVDGIGQKRFENVLQQIEDLTIKSELLDIGAATGYLVKTAQDRGWKSQGVEISKWATEYGQNKLNVKMFCGKLKDAKFKNNQFAVVTMFDVLEHLTDPLAELKDVNRVMKNKGILFIETINFDNFITKNIIGKNYSLVLPPWHLNYFSRRNLKQLLEKSGFRIIKQDIWTTSVGENIQGRAMYWEYLKIFLNPSYTMEDLPLNNAVKIYAQKK